MTTKETQMLAFHGKPAIKSLYVARIKAHAVADEIIQGVYWERGKGCAVGCTVHSGDHARYETELGIPRILARLEDRIFEGLTNGEAKAFPLRFLSAIQPGADLSMVWPKFAVWLLTDAKYGVQRRTKKDSPQWVAIQRIADLYAALESWEKRDKAAFRTAAYAADDADAADADANAAAYAAAYAAYAADDDAADAADAAYAAAYAADARSKYFKAQADKLCDLLRATESAKQRR